MVSLGPANSGWREREQPEKRSKMKLLFLCRRRLRGLGLCRLSLVSCVLFAVALVRTNEPIGLTAVLSSFPAFLAPLHPGGLGEDERGFS